MEKEWKDYYNMYIGQNTKLGDYRLTRFPGGILVESIKKAGGGSYSTSPDPSVSTSIEYIPFPTTLKQKLQQL